MNILPAIDDLTRRKRVLVARFQIPGDVVPWARAGGGKSMHRFTPKKQASYEGAIRHYGAIAMRGHEPIDDLAEIHVLGCWIAPKSYSKKKLAALHGWKNTKPDEDNVGKLVKDALNGIAYTDDARVCNSHTYKIFGEKAYLLVEIYRVTG